jgi:RNA-directed DNA polymerase
MKTFDKFANEIGFNKQTLDNYITFADNYYNTYFISKKDRKKHRRIDSPSYELKSIQRWILHNLFYDIEVSSRANGFIKERGIKRNAQFHLQKRFLLTIDVQNFFPSISQQMVFNALNKYFTDKEFALKLAKLCTYERRLPQGAPTSPVLSNIIFKEIDEEIKNYCNTKLIVYSRYADDLVFSCDTKNSLIEVYSFTNRILSSNSFSINKSKTRYMSGKGRMVITGVNINDGRPTVSKKIKRKLRSKIYNFLIKKDKSIDINQILGYLSFIKDIEPDYHKKILNYINKLKKY